MQTDDMRAQKPTDSTALQGIDPLGQFPAIARRTGHDWGEE
jgi:hypothetical protein